MLENDISIMKGIELPISTIVVIILVLIVLLASVAFFFGVWNPGVGGASLEATKNLACQMLISTGCNEPSDITIRDFDADMSGVIDNDDDLLDLCVMHYGITDPDVCKQQLCNCE
jgi:hypothetical protein